MSWQNVAPLFRGQGSGAVRGASQSSGGMAIDVLTSVVDRTIIPRRHQIRANGRTLDIFVRDRKVIGFRRYDDQGNGAFRLVTADAGREVAMPFMWALAGMGADFSEADLSVHRLDDTDRDALQSGKPLGLSLAEIQQRAGQGSNGVARGVSGTEAGSGEEGTVSNVVSFEKPLADRQAEPETPQEDTTRGTDNALPPAADSALQAPETETLTDAISSRPAVPARNRPSTGHIDQLVAMLGTDTPDIAHCAPDGTIRRPMGSSGELSDTNLSALHGHLLAWDERFADTAMTGAKLICAVGPDKDSAAMVCATDGVQSVYAEIRLARVGRLIGQWTQLAEKG